MKKYTNTELTALFLQSSIQDSEADYVRSRTIPTFPHWDEIVLTASNDMQAEGYRKQIEARRNWLPQNTNFTVVADEGNKRVGSAGSTLSVIRILKNRYASFSEKRVLVIHAGGNSSRCPQYSALGKLFAPLPTMLNGRAATLFDMFLITMASVPGRMKEGMLLLSGDVTLLFNPLMCDFGNASAAVISFKEDVETGKDHGVYVKNAKTGNVKKFLHKQTVERLRAEDAVDERDMCSIDTGAIWLCPEILEKLYSLIDTSEKYHAVVNDKVRLSLYSDIAYCLAEDSTAELFQKETPEGSFCPELTAVRQKLFEAIGSYNMKLMNLAPAKFVHFGSIPEILDLVNTGVKDYENLGWARQIQSAMPDGRIAAYDSVLGTDASVGDGTYLEAAYVHDGVTVGKNSYISFIELSEGTCVPSDVLLHGLKQMNGKFVCRIMGTHDNPKKEKLFGKDIREISEKLKTPLQPTLWGAELYPECDTVKEAVNAALNLYALIVNGSGDLEAWQNADRKSLSSGFDDADPQAIIDWKVHMEDYIAMEAFSKEIENGRPAREVALSGTALTEIQLEWLEARLKKLDMDKQKDFSYAMRLYYYLGVALGSEKYTSRCYKLIAETVLRSAVFDLKYREDVKIVSDETVVKLPLRVNWGGGWTDTCPYCIENGGVVLNAAITLGGEYPVEVRMVKIPEYKIVFDSRDMDVHGEFDEIEPLQQTGNPFDAFALQKACLLACGIIPREGGNMKEILKRLGGGFEMHSEVINVPKGSGLGTSSILAAAAVKAVLLFTGIPFNEDMLYETVLSMEQIMSTGGGWQDQVGGATAGIKFISSFAGLRQRLKVEHVELTDATKKELSERFAIIYTGQRRLARNLLRDVVGRYVGNEPDSLFAHKEIQKTAALMRFALERGDVDEFARLLDGHWALSQKIDAESSNTLIQQIFLSIDDLIDARMCCGAGGGGFLQVILKKGVSRQQIHCRLKEIFQDSEIDIRDAEILY